MFNPTRSFWADAPNPLEHCYRVFLVGSANGHVTEKELEHLYHALGNRGYQFHDIAPCRDSICISLTKQLSPKHLKKLRSRYKFTEDANVPADLSFLEI